MGCTAGSLGQLRDRYAPDGLQAGIDALREQIEDEGLGDDR